MVAMLAQAGCPRQERRVAEILGVRPEDQGDAVVGPALAIPIATLEKPGERIELRPGCGRFQAQSGLSAPRRGWPGCSNASWR